MKTVKAILAVLCILCFSSCGDGEKYSVSEEKEESIPEISAAENIIPQTTDIDEKVFSSDYGTIKWRNVKQSQYYKSINLKYGYTNLNSEDLRDLYEKTESALFTVSEEKDSKGRYTLPKLRIKNSTLDKNEIKIVLQAISLDYPQVFWVSNSFSYYYDDDSTLVQFYAVEDPGSLQDKINTFSATVSAVIEAIPGGLSEYEREKMINNLIVDNCTYDENAGDIKTDWQPYSIYGAIVNGKAICGGYASATQYLLNLVGIDAISVNGIGREELHMWNQVNIDGLWYNLDTTWNDGGDLARYDYFNVNDEIFYENHTPSEIFIASSVMDDSAYNLTVKKCSSDDANYFKKECIVYSGDDASKVQLTNAITEAAANKLPFFGFAVSDKIDYDSQMNKLFYESPYEFFVAVSEANELGSGILLENEISVSKKENFNAVMVKLSYTE